MKGWKWNPKIHGWDTVDVQLPKELGKINAEETETLLQRTKMSKHGKKWRKLLFGSSKKTESRL